ncbi:hypothetical protein AAHC03_04502 [Spirometra sp. Aus1]
MFRTLYIFVAVYILRGCPKIMPLVDHNRTLTRTWALNFTYIPATLTPTNVRVKPIGDYYVFSDAKLSRNSPPGNTMYTGIIPSSIHAHVQPRAFASTLAVQTITVDVILRRWPVFLKASLILCAAVALTFSVAYYTVLKYQASKEPKRTTESPRPQK